LTWVSESITRKPCLILPSFASSLFVSLLQSPDPVATEDRDGV
jgi:hypothetical protein